MHVTLVVNNRSGRTEGQVARVTAMLQEHGVVVDGSHLCETTRQLERCVRRATRDRAEVVVVGGGDGSMTVAANALAFSQTALGVLPLGTGNSFAQTIGLSGDLQEAVDAIAGGRIVQVDLGKINRKYFANFATIGFPAEVAASAPRLLKRIIGVAAYVVGAVWPFVSQGPFTAKVRWDNGRMQFRTRQIVVASGRFFGHQPLTPEASITSGKLAFFTTTGVSHAEVARTYLALALGQHAQLPDAHTFVSEQITVHARPRQRVGVDGEAFGVTPVRFGVARAALRVIVPETFTGAAG